jgi:hypothetical protein
MAAKQLQDMLTDLRAEIGHSTNVAHGINDRDTLLYYFNRTQIRLIPGIRLAAADRASGHRPAPRDSVTTPIPRTWRLTTSTASGCSRPEPLNEVTYGIGPAEMAFPTRYQQSWPTRRWMHDPDHRHVRGLAGPGQQRRHHGPVPAHVGDQDGH